MEESTSSNNKARGGKAAKLGARERVFAALGRWIVRHPYYPIIAWIVLLIVAIPTLTLLGNVTSNSVDVLPNSAPSNVAQNELSQRFPNTSAPAQSLLVVQGNDITGPSGQDAVLNMTSAMEASSSIEYLSSIETLYSSYAQYLSGQAQLGLGILAQGTSDNQSLLVGINGTANVLWLAPATYAGTWWSLAGNNTPASMINQVAYTYSYNYLNTTPDLSVRYLELDLLQVFYSNFTLTPSCAQSTLQMEFIGCSDNVARVAFAPLLTAPPLNQSFPSTISLPVLNELGIENFSVPASQQALAAGLLSSQSGMDASWLLLVWHTFPSLNPSTNAVNAWATGVSSGPVRNYPLPVPPVIYRSFVDPSNNVTLMVFTFSMDDSYTAPDGSQPVFNDLNDIDNIASSVLKTSDPHGTISYWQTGDAPLDLNENNILTSGIAFTLPISVIVLLIITALYFRSPVTPGVAFGPIGMALVIAMGGTFLVGTFITKVDMTTLPIQDAFVLGVGTDYSVFLLSRYREELIKGEDPKKAVVTTVTWAGESITISGGTVIISTLALAFSGVTLLSQWGVILSVSILVALLIGLTMVPALLTIWGPKVFWPHVGKRFAKSAEKSRERLEQKKTYFGKASGLAVRRAATIVGLTALISIPIVYAAINVPVTFDFSSQFPASQPSTEGLNAISNHFGPGYAYPIQILVTFQSPLLVGDTVNAAEFDQMAYMTNAMSSASGVSSVDSPTGLNGAPLYQWTEYSTLPMVQQVELKGDLSSYVGNDNSTVIFTVTTSSPGMSGNAMDTLSAIQANITTFSNTHSDVTNVAYAGAAAQLRDLNDETTLAMERMVIIVVVGLILVLLAILASLAIPLMAVATIGLSIAWALLLTFLVMATLLSCPIFFFDRVILFIVMLGLGMDYNIFILTRIREEKTKVASTKEAVVNAVTYTGGIITAAAVILSSMFFVLATSSFLLIATIGFSLGVGIMLDATLVRTYIMPGLISLLGERVWWLPGRKK
jgi:RND superfamily putative drug exporter